MDEAVSGPHVLGETEAGSSSLVAALLRQAARKPNRTAYVFLKEGGEEQERLTYARLETRALAIAAALRRSCMPGERALLLYPPGLDFVAAFFGCLLAGVIAVPAYPPRSTRMLPRLFSILADARPAVALTSASSVQRVSEKIGRTSEHATLPWIVTDELPDAPAGWQSVTPEPADVAFLQYTSGSTSKPKGVVVTHANLAHNQQVIQEACDHSEESVFVSWLPPYHDLGLIGNILQATWLGATCVLMSPVAFLQNPLRWLSAISRYRGTTSGGPNFAYDLCARKIPAEEMARLDLSSWRVAFNGAEPVREATLSRFSEAAAPASFRAGAMYPCYGLAEATLMVSGGHPGRGPVVRELAGRRLVGCGRVLPGNEVIVADPDGGTPCGEESIGEIWIAGGSVAQGYWNRPEETAHAFGATLPDGRGPWLRTGDLGALAGGELFIAGRLKDLIILRGRNHYPQDIEATAQRCHPALAGGTGAAFAVDRDGEERLVLVQEVERHAGATEEIVAAIRQAVTEEHEALVHEVVLVPPGGVPRTTSGKVQRRACRDLYLQGELRAVATSRLAAAAEADDLTTASPGSEAWLRHAFAAAARIDPDRIDPDRPLSASGLDSLAAIELKQAVEAGTGVSLPIAELLEGMTLREAARRAAAGAREMGKAEEEPPAETGEHPLSWGQRSLWFLHRLAPESAAYNIAGAARLEAVDAGAMARALQGLVARHPSLRTTYAASSGEPVPRTSEHIEVPFLRLDAMGWSDERIRHRLHLEAFRPFDLETGPVLRAALLERGSEAFLVLSVHHIAADFWSMAVLARELGALYRGETPPLPPALYTDFARQQQRLAGAGGQQLWEHWRQILSGAPPLALPTDRPRSNAQTWNGAARIRRQPASSIRELAAAHGCTEFVVLLAAWQALLGRWSGQEDFLVGAPTAGRSAPRFSDVVGYFVNTLPLRAHLDGEPAVGEWLPRVRSMVLAALEHQDMPLALLAERLQPDRDPSRPPLVQTLLTFQRAPNSDLAALGAFAVGEEGIRLDLGGLVLESIALESPAAQLELSLTATQLGDDLVLALRFNTDLFDADTAGRMLEHLSNLLAGMARRPASPVTELDLLSPAERRQLLADDANEDWNEEALHLPRDRGLYGPFEEQAERTPEATAVVCGELRLTYSELRERAGQVAAMLQEMGVGPEVLVGVCAERTPDLVAGLLGVLEAGGAYVPLDPAYPSERIAYLLADSAAPVLLTTRRLAAALPPYGGRIALLDGDVSSRASGRLAGIDPEQAAYVIYTSGTTGQPKGVVIRHGGALARLAWAVAAYPRERLAGVLAATSICFDLSVFELFAPLAAGGTVILADDALAFPDLPAASEVTLVNTVPSAMTELARSGRIPASVRAINLAGEPLRRELADRIYGLPGIAELWNLYGPSEDTTYSTGTLVPRASGEPPAIGRPLPGTRVRLLDRYLAPVPAGVTGELWIGGAGLARGYLDRPDVTADRFRPDPFAAEQGEPGVRLYRTGDLGRRQRGGEIDFLGRADFQVKLRGFRIEPGEVESALTAMPAVRETVVLVRPVAGDSRLTAYVAPAPGASLVPAELRDALARTLPRFMVPTAWVVLPELPRTPNGKVDRKALPDPLPAGEGARDAAPAGPTEELIAGVWANLLGVERVGAGDDFFALGGHSLLAAQVVARIREAFGVELPLPLLFAHPTLAALVEQVERLRGAGGEPMAPPVTPEPRPAEIPLSFYQESLWFLDQLAPSLPVYNLPVALRLSGPLETPALACALEEIVRRHEALRTVFAAREGLPCQVVLPPAPLSLPLIETGESEAWRLAAAEAVRPFDLSRGPLLRTLLLRWSPRDHLLVLNLHHIVADGWSMSLLLRELEALYAAGVAGLPSPLPELPVQYADYALWQRRWLSGAVLAGRLDWWRARLAGATAALDLPADRPRRAVQTYRGSSQPVLLPPDLVAGLRGLARRHGGTLFMTLLTGFAALLHRYCGQEDLTIGSPVADRSQTSLERLIGFFVSSLPLRARLAGEPDAAELLGRLRAETLGAYEHRDAPFDRLVEELHQRRDLARNPLFQVMLALEEGATAPPSLSGLDARIVPLATGTAKLDLTLALWGAGEALAGEVESSDDLFDAATSRRLLGHFVTLLRGLVEDPLRPVSRLPLLTAAERRTLIAQGTGDGAPRGGNSCLHDLFIAQAARTPDAVAVESADESLTYGELRRRSADLALRLQGLGVGPEIPVGLCAERTPALVVGLLGILTAGGIYLPLDPELPLERRWALLADAGAPLVLADASRLADFAGLAGLAAHPLDSGGTAAPGDFPRSSRPPAPTQDNLAYVFSTSGSTGRPKAVAVPHRGVVNRLAAAVEAFGIGPGDALAFHGSIGFDVSLWEIFAPLAAGARLVMPPPGDPRDIAPLRRLALERGVTLLDFAPSVLEAFLDGARAIPSLRGVFVGGEALPSTLAARCAAVLGCAPVNMYGPTEASIDILWHSWRPGDESRATVPLGRPIAGCSVLVLDRDLSPAPIGVPGELWLGGVCLARGYLGRPDLTAERFLPHPDPARPGDRLYRTGDLARWLPDGEIEFLGRVDHQVKIRGIRIEPAEIEAALRAVGECREAAVVAVGEGSRRRLAAYLVPADPAAPPDPSAVRMALRAILPEAMVPSSFTILSELPRTAGGKLDRQALPEPETPPVDTGAGHEPRTPLEHLVAGVWAHLFERERVDRDDDFWELGGHSLLAARAAARLGDTLHVQLPVRLLFEHPTVAALAAALESSLGATPPPLHPRPRLAPTPLSFAQERLWFLDRLEPGNPAYVVPLALRLRGPVLPAPLAAALAGVARRHEVLRATFSESGGRPAQEFSGSGLPLAVTDLRGLPPAARPVEATRRAIAEASRPFDLAVGPLGRATLLRMEEEEHLFLLNIHHIAFDGGSMSVLLHELGTLYAAVVEGTPEPLPPLPFQYADFALWQREWLDGGDLAAQLVFWREQMAGAPAALDLPADRPRHALQTFRGGAEPVTLPPSLVRDLRTAGRQQGATLFMVLLTGWSVLLHRSSGAPEVVMGTPVANRRRPELEGLIGLFVNTLPLRVDLAGDPPFAELLERVRHTALAVYENQDLPFERLVEVAGTGRDLSRSPIFQAMLALEEGAPPVLRLPGVTAEEVPLHNGTAKLELLLALAGTDGGGLAGGLEFNADLFDAPTARRWADQLARLLAGAAADPRLRVGDLPLLAATEEWQILTGWNATAAPFPPDLGLHEMFEAQAARTPRATALIHGEERMSYRELDAWADGLARRLRSLRVGPEVLVGVFCGRNPGMVAAVLAVLKAGGAYLPLDPAYPADRLAFLLRDADAPVVLAEERLAAALPPFAGVLVPVDRGTAQREEPEGGEHPRGFLHPEQAAYAIYTSGSTGTPKGVIIRHGGAVARMSWALSAHPREVLAGVLAATSLCFDLSVFEIFVPLAAGGAVVLADDALALPDLPEASSVTLVNTVPSAMAELVRAGALPRSVRMVNLAGEPLRRDLVARLHALEGIEQVHNLYGPSEDTTYSTEARIERGDEREPAIGRPLPNTRVYLLDPALRPVPVGAPGELWLGGEGLARGYLRRPDLTADRFRPDPFGPPAGRLYRTGDLARRRADGTLDYLGRLDHQVKVRGFRVELGEVEAALLAHPGVREAAVIALADGGSRRLVACMAPARDEVPVSEMRRHLAARLPAFMVPAVFLSLPALPLTLNGKVDRRALEGLAPGAVRQGRAEYVAPRNAVEEVLAPLWTEILGIDRVGADDDFFALGGHSLAGVRLVSRVRQMFGVRLPVRELFLAPTLAGMAGVLAAEMAAMAGDDLMDEIDAEMLHG